MWKGYCFGIVNQSNVRLHLFLSSLVWSITSTLTNGFKYDWAQLFFIMTRCASSNICLDKSKVKVKVKC